MVPITIWHCNKCLSSYETDKIGPDDLTHSHVLCSGTLSPYFSASDIENLIKGRIEKANIRFNSQVSSKYEIQLMNESILTELEIILAALEVGEK